MTDFNGDSQESSIPTSTADAINVGLDTAKELDVPVPGYAGIVIDAGATLASEASDGDLTVKDAIQGGAAVGGGAAGSVIGAAAGSVVLPGAGTVAGAYIGGKLGGEGAEGVVNGVSDLLGDQSDTVVTQVHGNGTEHELTQTYSKSSEVWEGGVKKDVVHVAESGPNGSKQWSYTVDNWETEKARLETQQTPVTSDPENTSMQTSQPVTPVVSSKEGPVSAANDGGKGSTVEPEPTPAPKPKPKEKKKKDSGKPVVVDLDGDGIETTSLDESDTMFDFDNDGFREKTAWVGADDGLLVFDVGGDGQVTEAREIAFAEWTEDETDTDLEGLRKVFDTNNDGMLDADDQDWSGFRIWQDENQNGVSDEGEFLTLEEAGIQSIGLEHIEGSGEVHEDGTVNYGMIDVQMTDGSVNQGGDIAFAFEEDGQREVVDADGNTTIEYESDTFVFAEPSEGFTVTDYDNFVTRIQNMGITDTAISALQYAQQSGSDVVFDFGDETLTLEDVSLEQLELDLHSFADDLLVA